MPLKRYERHFAAVVATLTLVVLLAVGCLAATSAAYAAAGRGGGSTTALLNDASDGVVDGTYSISTVRAALSVVRSDPSYMQYSDIEGVLVQYLASLTHTPSPTSSHTKKPTPTATTPSAAATTPGGNKQTPKAGATPVTPGATTADGATASPSGGAPLPDTSTGSQAGKRLAAVPWLIAAGVAVIVFAVVLLGRRRRA